MRRTRLVLMSLGVAAMSLNAQQRGMYGGISTGQMVGVTNNAGFASGLGATVSGLPQTGARIPISGGGIYGRSLNNGGHHWNGRGGRTVVVPYGVPIGYGLGYSGYGYGYDAPPVQTIVQPLQSTPSVIINQYYTPEVVRPQMKEYSDLPEPSARAPRTEVDPPAQARVYPPAARQPAPAPKVEGGTGDAANKATLTLLAFKDGSVVASIAYWVQNDQLHYVTKSYAKKVVDLSTLDRATSIQLNKERNVEFAIE